MKNTFLAPMPESASCVFLYIASQFADGLKKLGRLDVREIRIVPIAKNDKRAPKNVFGDVKLSRILEITKYIHTF